MEDTVILTPNRRLSAWLTEFYNQRQIESGKTAWESPDILPYNSWLLRTWEEYCYSSFADIPVVLTSHQETYLWESIVSKSEASQHLLQISAAADLAQSANSLLKQWNLSTSHSLFESTEDCKIFKTWSDEFSALCQKNNWITNSEIANRLNECILDCHGQTLRGLAMTNVEKKLVLYGFTELSPVMLQLKTVLDVQSAGPELYNLTPGASSPRKVTFNTPDDELIAAACWAKHLYSKNISAKIGVVIPTLDTSRTRVKQIFNDVFQNRNHFNITAGLPLAKYPVVKAALELLQMAKKTVTQQEFSAILATPFCGEAEKEHIRRSNLDARIRQDNLDMVRLTDLADEESNLSLLFSKSSISLLKRLRKWLSILPDTNAKHSYREWQYIFSEQLRILGWPGERSLNSDEFQVVDKWFEMLVELAKLDQVATPVTFATAISTLGKLANKQVFQPKTPTANIQIMGILEAASLQFDHLWITGLNDAEWPPQPGPNPFIPLRLQREYNMPHATSQRELEYCQQITEQFIQCASDCIFSYAEKLDKIEVSASPLIRSFSDLDQIVTADYMPANLQHLGKVSLECIIDNTAPIIDPNEKISGGVSVIKDQALCPFKSFSTWRLHARELEEPLPGLRKKDRGTITHKILEKVWIKLQESSRLHELSSDTLTALIDNIVIDIFNASKQTKQQQPEFLKLEKTRLTKLINDWLDLEKKRPPFTVYQQEAETSVKLGNLSINARIDRIDKLADGSHLIIDYKTGSSVKTNNWFDERPEEPQLPIYALQDANTCGITFGQVYTGNCAFDGVAKEDVGIDGIVTLEKKQNAKSDWKQQVSKWQTDITLLADEFYDGEALPNPKNGHATCQWCSLQPFCRIHQESLDE